MDWQSKTIYYQLGNIGSEVGRAMKWKGVNTESAESAATRALELIDLTIADKKNKTNLKEITRIREVFCDTFYGNNIYKETTESWDRYFLPYALAANKKV